MHRFEIFVAPNPVESLEPVDTAATEPSSGTRRSRRRAREVIDIFLGGANVTARVHEGQAFAVLRDIARATLDLTKHLENKAIVRFYDEPWELALERFGAVASLSVYRAGGEPQVVAYDQRVAFGELVDGVLEALETVPTTRPDLRDVAADLERLTTEQAVPTDFVDLAEAAEFAPEVMDGECAS